MDLKAQGLVRLSSTLSLAHETSQRNSTCYITSDIDETVRDGDGLRDHLLHITLLHPLAHGGHDLPQV